MLIVNITLTMGVNGQPKPSPAGEGGPPQVVDEVSRGQRLYIAKTVRFFREGRPLPYEFVFLSFVRKNRL